MQNMQTVTVRDNRYLEHDPGYGHPESPERLKAIYSRLDQKDMSGMFRKISPRMATREELEWCHHPEYIERVSGTSGIAHVQLDSDTATSASSWDVARLAAGGLFTALDMIFSGEAVNGFVLARPPGHHAEYDHAMGFCLFNNIALGAEYAMRNAGAKRVLIVDWDLHHGNGTQNCFYHSGDCLYFSAHQYPYYPGSGALEECGAGDGKGFTFNVPIYTGAGDDLYASLFNRLLHPVALDFQPDIILVSAGFDIYRSDPLGGMAVSVNGFAYMARKLREIAEECCNGRLLFCLEGGYDLAGLRDGVLAVLLEATGRSVLDDDNAVRLSAAGTEPDLIGKVRGFQKQFWPCLS